MQKYTELSKKVRCIFLAERKGFEHYKKHAKIL